MIMHEKQSILLRVGVTLSVIISVLTLVSSLTDPNDVRILNEFRKNIENSELLQWPDNGDDPCGPPLWKHVFCTGNRVAQIQVQGLGLRGTLPKDFNRLSKLSNLGLQRNQFYGSLPSFSGLSELEFAYLDFNGFDSIPSDFFDGLTSIRVLALDENPINSTTGWNLPPEVGKLTQLVNFSLGNCSLLGPLPEFLGSLPSLTALKMAYNRLSGVLPSSFNQSILQILWLNDQSGEGLTGTIDVIPSMSYLTQLWLHGNSFTGTIPEGIGKLSSLKDLNLNGNKFVGLIPQSLGDMELNKLDLNNNFLMGPIPKFKAGNVSYASNLFCQPSTPGAQCGPQVNALLEFLSAVNYPLNLVPQWSGNDPCGGSWLGVSCDSDGSKVIVINLPNRHLNGSLSPALARLDSLREIRLAGNNLAGKLPANLTRLKSLRLLDVSGNKIEPPLPKFRRDVKLVISGNPLLEKPHHRAVSPAPPVDLPPPGGVRSSPVAKSPLNQGRTKSVSPKVSHSAAVGANHTLNSSSDEHIGGRNFKKFTGIVIVAAVGSLVLFVLLVLVYILCCKKKKAKVEEAPSCSVVVHPQDSSEQDNVVKLAVSSNNNTGSFYAQTASSSSGTVNSHVIESGNLVISVQVLRRVTNNFSPENELGRGGFGVVYKGELEDGTKIAVKRMEAGVICSKQLDEFQAEIAVLSKVRHRHLVSLFGYSTEGYERLLVYEYMPQGALSKHLFHWRSNDLEPLSWKRRLSIALDVARGMEYLHTLAHQSFIHRDLKSSNILLDDEYRAKVSDFGLVKLAPDRDKSVQTRLAGTFGYLAPEYAVTGKVTTKVDVFSFGVVLMELLTGLVALDEDRPETKRYLVEWFWTIKSTRETLMEAIDPVLDIKKEEKDEEEEGFAESINIVADLAGHCTARDPNHRPDMGHAVTILASLLEKWSPFYHDEAEEYLGINYNLPLKDMLKDWQNNNQDSTQNSYTSIDDSRGSIPARPTGFAHSFTSADAR